MLYFRKTITNYLRYPLMWVMLLWAITMPGHEVIIYDFVLDVISGKPVSVCLPCDEEVARPETHVDLSHIFTDAVPGTFTGKFQLQPHFFQPSVVALFLHRSVALRQTIAYTCQPDFVQKLYLLLAILPNAP